MILRTVVKLAAVIWITKPQLQAIPWFTLLNLAHFPTIFVEPNGPWIGKTGPATLN
jgi:hypothetical protein